MTDTDRRSLLTAAGSGLAAVLVVGRGRTAEQSSTRDEASSTRTATTTKAATTTTETDATTTEPMALKQRTREFVRLLDDGSYERAHGRLDSNAASQIRSEQLRQLWTGLEGQLGEFRTLAGLETATQDGYDVVTGVARFENGRREIELAFGDEGIAGLWVRQVAADWSAPSYADESAFTEREVSLSATHDCSLGGTLTIPEGVERAPGVVLVHGQGPSDRDGTVGPNKPYKDLAWGLASRGIAVLRYDKRTQVCEVDFAELTIDDAVTEDALTAVERLRETEVVADDDVVVAGHSIGATLAPRIAARDGDLAGVVMLAPLARTAAEAIVAQNEYLAERDGTVTDAERQQLEQVRNVAERIRSLNITDDEVVYLGGDEYWRSLAEYDGVETATGLDVPLLILQGERDYQVTVEEDLATWRDALGDEPNVTVTRYPRLNHFFMPGSGKPGREEYFQQNNVAEEVVADVAAFVADATGDATTAKERATAESEDATTAENETETGDATTNGG